MHWILLPEFSTVQQTYFQRKPKYCFLVPLPFLYPLCCCAPLRVQGLACWNEGEGLPCWNWGGSARQPQEFAGAGRRKGSRATWGNSVEIASAPRANLLIWPSWCHGNWQTQDVNQVVAISRMLLNVVVFKDLGTMWLTCSPVYPPEYCR